MIMSVAPNDMINYVIIEMRFMILMAQTFLNGPQSSVPDAGGVSSLPSSGSPERDYYYLLLSSGSPGNEKVDSSFNKRESPPRKTKLNCGSESVKQK